MRYTYLFLTGLTIWAFAACKKDSPDYGNGILGHWKYESSSLDSMDVFTGQWKNLFKGYDDAIASGFAESLFFSAKDTVVYTFSGITAWNKYKILENKLILTGSSSNDTLTIYSVSNTGLEIGKGDRFLVYKMMFSKY